MESIARSSERLDCLELPAPNYFGRFPISKNFLIAYPDGSKRYVSRLERDDLVLSGLARKIDSRTFEYTGQQKTFHSFVDWAKEYAGLPAASKRRFLEGQFVIEHKDKRRREWLETAEECALQLPKRILKLQLEMAR